MLRRRWALKIWPLTLRETVQVKKDRKGLGNWGRTGRQSMLSSSRTHTICWVKQNLGDWSALKMLEEIFTWNHSNALKGQVIGAPKDQQNWTSWRRAWDRWTNVERDPRDPRDHKTMWSRSFCRGYGQKAPSHFLGKEWRAVMYQRQWAPLNLASSAPSLS